MDAHEIVRATVELFRSLIEGWRSKHVDLSQAWKKCAGAQQVHASVGQNGSVQKAWKASARKIIACAQEYRRAAADAR